MADVQGNIIEDVGLKRAVACDRLAYNLFKAEYSGGISAEIGFSAQVQDRLDLSRNGG
jgi:hypothetical protein